MNLLKGLFGGEKCGYFPKVNCPYPKRKKEQEKIRDMYGHFMPGKGCDVYPECSMWKRVIKEDILND